MTLIVIILYTVTIQDENFKIYTTGLEVFIARFMAALLLHMELIEDVKQGLLMMDYLNTHPEKFKSHAIPFCVGFMQSIGGLVAEFVNIFMLATRTTAENCITFFVAFHVLVAIDNIYAEALVDFPLKKSLHEPLKYETEARKISFRSRTFGMKLLRIFLILYDSFFKTVYYYFLPFLVNWVPYFKPGSYKDYKYLK
jgi:hypothetical protein